MMPFFINNRNRILKKLEKDSILVLFSGEKITQLGDQFFPFTPNRNFYYLTGLDKPSLILLLMKTEEETKEIVFIERYSEEKAKWDGKTIDENLVTTLSGIKTVHFLDEFKEIFSKLIFSKNINNLYLDIENRYFKPIFKSFEFANDVKQNYPTIQIKNVYNLIGDLRIRKYDGELEHMRTAIYITKLGIENILKNAKKNMFEYEVEAFFDYELKKNGVKEKAFQTILASGKNATTLHYGDNNCKIEDGSLVLIDLGATYEYYSADISRTFPINGKFSERQKLLYNIVLNGQQLVINSIKEGVSKKSLNDILIKYYEVELLKIGLIKDKSEVSKYYYHNVGHHLGLETHDILGVDCDILKEGMVITVEPGLYIKEEGIGIRIEDDILVTKDGHINLSKKIIKTVDEIENFMQQYNN